MCDHLEGPQQCNNKNNCSCWFSPPTNVPESVTHRDTYVKKQKPQVGGPAAACTLDANINLNCVLSAGVEPVIDVIEPAEDTEECSDVNLGEVG